MSPPKDKTRSSSNDPSRKSPKRQKKPCMQVNPVVTNVRDWRQWTVHDHRDCRIHWKFHLTMMHQNHHPILPWQRNLPRARNFQLATSHMRAFVTQPTAPC